MPLDFDMRSPSAACITPWLRRLGAGSRKEISSASAMTFVKKRKPDGIFIFITPPSTEELLHRLTGRNTESPEALAVRQREALIELGLAKDYEHVVCNRDVDQTAREILAMIAAEHARRHTPV